MLRGTTPNSVNLIILAIISHYVLVSKTITLLLLLHLMLRILLILSINLLLYLSISNISEIKVSDIDYNVSAYFDKVVSKLQLPT